MPLRSAWFRFGWTAAAILAAAAVIVTAIWERDEARADQWVRHTLEVIDEVRTLQGDLHDVGGFVREYALSRQQSWLTLQSARVASARSELAALRQLVPDSPAQLNRLDSIQEHLARLVEWSRYIVGRARTGGFPAAVADLAAGRGRTEEAALDGDIDGMVSAEENLLRAREAHSGRLRAAAAWIDSALGLVVALVVAGTVAAFRLQEAALNRERALAAQSREFEAERERAAQRLRQSNAELESFAYTVAHDLRAPLRGVKGFSEALVEDFGPRLEPRGLEYLQHISNAATRMDELIRDLLDYSRLSRGDLELGRVSLDEALAQAREQVESELAARHAVLDVDPHLPAVVAHGPTLVQVVANLLGNAAKFAAPGVVPAIRVHVERRAKRVRLWVEDNGIGIAPEHQERIFGVFERLHTQQAYPGTGIGLAIVRKGMERMAGNVGVVSAAGAGARFWIELPEAPAA